MLISIRIKQCCIAMNPHTHFILFMAMEWLFILSSTANSFVFCSDAKQMPQRRIDWYFRWTGPKLDDPTSGKARCHEQCNIYFERLAGFQRFWGLHFCPWDFSLRDTLSALAFLCPRINRLRVIWWARASHGCSCTVSMSRSFRASRCTTLTSPACSIHSSMSFSRTTRRDCRVHTPHISRRERQIWLVLRVPVLTLS